MSLQALAHAACVAVDSTCCVKPCKETIQSTDNQVKDLTMASAVAATAQIVSNDAAR